MIVNYDAIKHFCFMLEGRTFVIFTDHKPLTYAFSQPAEKATPRQSRQLGFISQFSMDIRHVSGKDKTVADTLSRVEAINFPSPIDYDKLADCQEDQDLQDLLNSKSLVIGKVRIPESTKKIYCDLSTDNIRPYIPKHYRQVVFKNIHGLSHPGIRTTVKLITQKFIWPSINADIRDSTRSCITCQRAKVNKHTRTPLAEFSVPDQRFAHINIDIVGRLQTCQGYQYLLTVVDRFSKWLEAFPIENQEAETLSKY